MKNLPLYIYSVFFLFINLSIKAQKIEQNPEQLSITKKALVEIKKGNSLKEIKKLYEDMTVSNFYLNEATNHDNSVPKNLPYAKVTKIKEERMEKARREEDKRKKEQKKKEEKSKKENKEPQKEEIVWVVEQPIEDQPVAAERLIEEGVVEVPPPPKQQRIEITPKTEFTKLLDASTEASKKYYEATVVQKLLYETLEKNDFSTLNKYLLINGYPASEYFADAFSSGKNKDLMVKEVTNAISQMNKTILANYYRNKYPTLQDIKSKKDL